MLAYTRIEAPFAGVVVRRNVDIGDLTRPGADGLPLFIVARSDIVTIAVDVPESVASEINPGDRASVRLQAMKGSDVEARVTRISWALDPKTRTIRAEIDLPNPEGRLRPGLYAYATIVAVEHPDALIVPASAVVEEEGKTRCLVVIDGKAVRRPVVAGIQEGTRVEIVSGLAAGDSVVKAGATSLVDGQPIEVVAPAPPTVKAPGKAG